MDTEKTAILILNWKQSDETIRCLSYLLREPQAVTIVLVDNGSNDQSVSQIFDFMKTRGLEIFGEPPELVGAKIERFKVNEVDLILVLSSENRGFTGGMNLAAQIATQSGAESLFLLNNDAEIAISDVYRLREISRANNDAIVGPVLYDFHDREKVLFSGRKWPHLLFGLGSLNVDWEAAKIWKTGYVEGSAVFLPAVFLNQKIAKDGYLFDDSYFLYCEDVDLSLSAKKFGFLCLLTNNVKAYHKVSLSSGGLGSPSAYYYITRNRILLAKKWLRLSEYSLFIIYYFSSRVVLSIKRSLLGHGREINFAVLKGLFHGVAGRTGYER